MSSRRTHDPILLLVDEPREGGALKDEEIARALKVSAPTAERVRGRSVEEGLASSLNARSRRTVGGGA